MTHNTFWLLALFVFVITINGDDDAACNHHHCDLGSFCGTDGECHPFSCHAWYELGPLNFTGYNASNAAPLECVTVEETTLDHSGVFYRCGASNPINQAFTRKCNAQPSTDPLNPSEFTCYEIDATTDFSRFLERVDGSECPPDNVFDTTGSPMFVYAVFIQHYIEDKTGSVGHIGSDLAHNVTTEFFPEFALQGPMYAKFTEYHFDPTEAPTISDSQVPTEAPSISDSQIPTEDPSILASQVPTEAPSILASSGSSFGNHAVFVVAAVAIAQWMSV